MSLDLDPSVIWRDFTTDGIPSSGAWDPRKAEIRESLSAIRQAVIALLADADPGLALPNLLIRATDAGTGTPNAIQATTNLPIPAGNATALIALNILETNTASPVTISLNGGPALTIKTNSGNDVAAGGLASGMVVLGFVTGSTFRVVTDQVSAAIVAEAEAARDDAEAAASSVVFKDFGTATEAAAAAISASAEHIRTGGYSAPGDGGGALYIRVAVEPDHPFKFQSADGAWWELAPGSRLTPITTLLVPAHFSDLPSAFAFMRNRPVPLGQTVEVRMQAGYQITKGVLFQNDDFSRVRITSVDAVVNVASGFVGVAASSDPFEQNSLFVASRSMAPRIECLIDMQTYGGCGFVLTNNSDGFVAGSAGIQNAGAYGLYVNKGSRCIAANADFRLAGWGNRVTTNSLLEAPQCNFSQARNATYEGSNAAANLDVSRGSLAYITGTEAARTNLQGGKGHGLAVRRSFVSATHVDCSLNEQSGLNAGAGSIIAFAGSRVSACLVDGIACDGAHVDANSSTIINNGRYNIYADSGGAVTARSVTCGGAGTNSVRAANGSRVNVSGGTCRRGASDAATDLVVSGGSIIHAVGATGGTNIAALTLNIAGLIFK